MTYPFATTTDTPLRGRLETPAEKLAREARERRLANERHATATTRYVLTAHDFDLERAEVLTRRLTMASDFLDLLGLGSSYRPTLRPDLGLDYEELADLYDRAQALRGDDRRAYRG